MINKKKILSVVSIVASIAMFGTVANAAPFSPGLNVVNIYRDHGGQVIKYAIKAKKLTKADTKIRISGLCDSACTLYLSVPSKNICIKPGANFGFHRAYGSTARANQTATNYMMGKYPSWVRSWIRANGGLSTRVKRMDYAYASKYLRTCESATRSAKARKFGRTRNAFSSVAKFGKPNYRNRGSI